MNVSKEELARLELIGLYLKNGTFTLRGVDVTQFVETRIWLAQEIAKAKKPVDTKPKQRIKPMKKKVK